jgi:polyisoprenoid-binding protein YceI
MRRILAILFLILSQQVFGVTYEINPQHTQIKFEIDYMTVSSVEGLFKKFKGQFEYTQEQFIIEKADIQIEAKSIDTSDEKRDKHLMGKDFFATQNFPFISLHLNKVQLPLNKKVRAEFLVEIKGIKRKETFLISNLGSTKDPWGKPSTFFMVEGEISRKNFGLNWNRTLDQGGYLIGDKVKLKVRIEAQESGKKTPFSRYYIPATESIDNLAKAQRGEIKSPTKIEIQTSVKSLEVIPTKVTQPKDVKGSEVNDNFTNIFLGFIGFIVTSLICILIKMKLLKKIKEEQKSSYYTWEIIGDSLVLIIVFIYSVLFYQLIYPN